jgi:3-hydroxyisobutyrate dehydrogenase-like beta-hydroxyacid dehydrogenase
MPNEIRTVAFIGLGKMGSPMAANVARAGFELTVYNRTPEKMQPLLALGAKPASSARHAAQHADVVITNLMDDASVRSVVSGAEGLVSGLSAGAVHIGTTTNSPTLASELASLHRDHGSHYVAAPVLGRPEAAAEKRLVALVAGDPQIVERCRPLFSSFAATVTYLGAEPRTANSAKLAVNYFVISLIDLMGDVYAWAEKSGVSTEVIAGFLRNFLGHPGLQAYAAKVRARDFAEGGFELKGGLKDVDLMLAAAEEIALPLPHAAILRDKFAEGLRRGMEREDWSAITEVTRARAGIA